MECNTWLHAVLLVTWVATWTGTACLSDMDAALRGGTLEPPLLYDTPRKLDGPPHGRALLHQHQHPSRSKNPDPEDKHHKHKSLHEMTQAIYEQTFQSGEDRKQYAHKLSAADMRSQELFEDPFARRLQSLPLVDDGVDGSVGEGGQRGRSAFQPDSIALRDPAHAKKGAASEETAMRNKEPLRPRELPSTLNNEQERTEEGQQRQTEKRRARVVEGIKFAYGGYETYAFGRDELQPVSKGGVDNFGGLGATIIDSVDTLYIAGLKDELNRATAWVKSNLTFEKQSCLSLFETNIRIVGGLISAYEFTQEAVYLEKAQDIAERLFAAFAVESGLPCNNVCLPQASAGIECGHVGLAEIGTFSVEFHALSRLTKDPKYDQAADRIFKTLMEAFPGEGILPQTISQIDPKATPPKVFNGIGAGADSYYEYLIKYWILTGCQAEEYRAAWERSVDEMMTSIFFYTKENPTAFVGESDILDQISFRHRQEHLACFMPGNLALGVLFNAVPANKLSHYFAAAHDLTKGCYSMYAQSPTGLSPESVYVDVISGNLTMQAPYQWLRPEVVESIFYMWRITKNQMYRNWAWQIFLAFEKHSKVSTGGYSGLYNAWDVGLGYDDQMQSFYIAETLKYLYLIFDDDAVPLDQWVFNTEAHPVKITNPGCKVGKQQ